MDGEHPQNPAVLNFDFGIIKLFRCSKANKETNNNNKKRQNKRRSKIGHKNKTHLLRGRRVAQSNSPVEKSLPYRIFKEQPAEVGGWAKQVKGYRKALTSGEGPDKHSTKCKENMLCMSESQVQYLARGLGGKHNQK